MRCGGWTCGCCAGDCIESVADVADRDDDGDEDEDDDDGGDDKRDEPMSPDADVPELSSDDMVSADVSG
jgi:hypothetical protein